MAHEIKTIRTSISIDDVFDDIAEALQDDDALAMDFDAIREALEKEISGFLDFKVNVEIDTEKKEIVGVWCDD